ncbi:MAG: hypothetical protein ABW252_08710 [Polyangiales bacterium]
MLPTYFAPLVLLGGALASSAGSIYLMMFFCLFGAAAAISLPALGGSCITPAVMFLPFLMLRALKKMPAHEAFHVSRPALWLGLTATWGAVSAYYLPRFFADATKILTVDRASDSDIVTLFPLRPVSGNITQTGYAFGALAAFLAMRTLLRERHGLTHFRNAVLLLAMLNVAAAVIHVGEFYSGLTLLKYVRTAGYAMFDAYEEAGLVRIQGTFSEASAFALFTLPLFAFAFNLWIRKVRPFYSGAVALATLAALLLSTSGTAYVGLGMYGMFFGIALLLRGMDQRKVPRARALAVAACLALVAVGAAFMLETEIAERITRFFDHTVAKKLNSDSGVERSSWNRQAWENFLDTYGLGTGLGSARASSFALVLLSNLGVIGSVLFGGFILQVFGGGRAPVHPVSPVVAASRHAVLAGLAGALMSASVFDLGVGFYCFAAAASVVDVKHARTVPRPLVTVPRLAPLVSEPGDARV